MNGKDTKKYEVLRELALAGARGAGLESNVREALARTAEVVGLNGASLYLWTDPDKVDLQVSYADSESAAERLGNLENGLFRRLREENELVSAYMSFGGDNPCHTFTLPLIFSGQTLGAVIGLQFGDRTVVAEDLFLETLSAAIAVQSMVTSALSPASADTIEKERLNAIMETAVTVNHEINNPLTAILGNVQLLLLKRGDLDEELRGKLEVVEAAATRIKDVTQRLMSLTSARSVNYTGGTSMIDISADPLDPEGGPGAGPSNR